MYTKANAEAFKTAVRKFFDGVNDDHSGAKSDNKKYVDEPQPGYSLKEGQFQRRNEKLGDAQKIRVKIHSQKTNGQFPADLGSIISKQKLRGGNCAEMTWLTAYYFAAKKANIWVMICDGDHQFCILSLNDPTDMTYSGEDRWVIDPWANIVCKPCEYKQKFEDKMAKWHGKGKRIGVPNKEQTAYEFKHANEEKWMSSVVDKPVVARKGWNFT